MRHISREQEDKDYQEYVNTPGKLSLKQFRPKLPFNINKGLAGYSLKDLGTDFVLDFDVYLPTKGKNLQRGFVWTELQKKELIISFLKGVTLPSVTAIMYRDDTITGERRSTLKIIDGKQRISTLLSFYRGEFSIEFEGKSYYFDDLSNQAKRELDDCLRFDIGYEYPDALIPDDVKIAWFEMINFAGTPQDLEHLKNLKS